MPSNLSLPFLFYFMFFFSLPHFLNIKTFLPIDEDIGLLGCNFEHLSFAYIYFKFLHLKILAYV